jgi:hypothetical protein
MLPDLENIKVQSYELVEKEYLVPLKRWWALHRKLVESYLSLLTKYEQNLKNSKEQVFFDLEFREKVSALLSQYVKPNLNFLYTTGFIDYWQSAEKYVSLYTTKVAALQPDSAMVPLVDDGTFLKAGKQAKRLWFTLTRFPWRLRNLFLKFLGKPLRPVPPLIRQVPVQSIMLNFLSASLPEELLHRLVIPLQNRMMRELEILLEIDKIIENLPENIQNGISINTTFKGIKALTDDLRKEKIYPYDEAIQQSFLVLWPQLEIHFERGGTLELPTRTFSNRKIKRRQAAVSSQYRKLVNHGNIKWVACFDKWQARSCFNQFAKQVKQISNDTCRFIENYLVKGNLKIIDEIHVELIEISDMLVHLKDDAGLEKVLPEMTRRVKENISGKLIPKGIELADNEDIIIKIQEYIGLALEHAIQITESVGVVSASSGSGKILTVGDITRVKIRELVEHDCLPILLDEAGHIKSRLINAGSKLREQLLETGQIAEYNLETAISLLGSESNNQQVKQIASEGLERAIARVDEADKTMKSASGEVSLSFENSFQLFQQRLESYLQDDNLIEARSRVLKAKALKKSSRLWQQFLTHVNGFLIVGTKQLKKSFVYSRARYQAFRAIVGLENTSVSVSPEISDFLAETEKAISRLPYVYQRLFVLSPLDDEKFFRGRNTELNQLAVAYQNWQAGRYAPTVIVGETGSGTTSLLNLFCRNFLSGNNIYRFEFVDPVPREDGFFSILQDSLPGAEFKNKSELINYLKNLPDKPVIILEGIHHLFLRTIHGFDAIKLFAEVISATNQYVYWLTTSTLYGWQYLDKAVQLSDFFGYVITLHTLSDDEIVDVILRRHIASGYNLRYELTEGDKPGRKYNMQKSEKEQQDYLRKRYFNALNQFARSNIAISMLLWLRSARDIQGNEITIALPIGLNVSFINSLTREKLFVLQSLLVHDGLPGDLIAGVLNYTPEKVRLLVIQLFDDGVIVQKRGLYVVNPLLYRQVVSTLKATNLLH